MAARWAKLGVLAGCLMLVAVSAAFKRTETRAIAAGALGQSCDAVYQAEPPQPAEPAGGAPGLPSGWPKAPAGLLPDRVHLRTLREGFNRLYDFATRRGRIYGRLREGDHPWRRLPLPGCFAGRVAQISVDDDEMIALDDQRHVFTMNRALDNGSKFSWTGHWSVPLWMGPGITLPPTRAWAWTVISPLEDHNWTDPAGNRTAIGAGKVSHIWGLRPGGRRITFWDPWLPLDQSYEMCGPHRGRFRAVNLSAAGSYVFVVGRFGDMFTRLYDFDISGHDPIFFDYSYEDQRGKGDGAPIQLPPAGWTRQPKVPGRITAAISISKVGVDSVHRILQVEGARGGRSGFWQRDVAWPRAKGWRFHPTGAPLTRKALANPPGNTSRRGLGRGEDRRYRMHGGGVTATLLDYNVYCSPATLRWREGGKVRHFRLHNVDGLRQVPRARGLDDEPRAQYGEIEWGPGNFEAVTVQATRAQIEIPEHDWTFKHVPAAGRGGT